jgi:hypothetical protein
LFLSFVEALKKAQSKTAIAGSDMKAKWILANLGPPDRIESLV